MLVSEHLQVRDLARAGVKRGTFIKWMRKFQDNILTIFILSVADSRAAHGPLSDENEKSRYEAWVKKNIADYYGGLKQKFEKKNLISGKDLMYLGIKPGPEMGKILAQIRQAQDEGSVNDREAALEMARNILSKRP
jgi:poly(A) polymerase